MKIAHGCGQVNCQVCYGLDGHAFESVGVEQLQADLANLLAARSAPVPEIEPEDLRDSRRDTPHVSGRRVKIAHPRHDIVLA